MAWPSDRLTTYAPRSQLKSADLNAIQDAIIGQQHGLIPMSIPAIAGSPTDNLMSWNWDARSVNFTSGAWLIPISIPIGSRIVNLRGDVLDSATGPTIVRMSLWRNATNPSIVGQRDSVGTGNFQTLVINAINETVSQPYAYSCQFSQARGTAQVRVYRIEIEYDHPLGST